MSDYNINYTRDSSDLNTQFLPTLHGRYQAELDYNGAISNDDDPADYYRPAKAVKVG